VLPLAARVGEAKIGKRKRMDKHQQPDLFSGQALPEIRRELAAILELLK